MTEEALSPAPAAPETVSEAPAAPSPQETPAAPEREQAAPVAAAGEKPRSRREAIEAALAKVSEDDSKSRPEGQKTEATGDQPRGPDGKFLPKDGEKPAEAAQKPVDGQKAPEAAKPPADDKSPLSEPPSRFSADAKAAWKDAPDAIKGEVKRALNELEGGLQKYRQTVEPLKPFLDMAQKSGTTVHEALSRYVTMEQALRTNPAQGLRVLAQNMGMTPADMAAILTGQAPQGEAAQTNAKDREIVGLRQQIGQLQQQLQSLGQTVQTTQQTAIEREVQSFAAQHPRFDELAPEITRMLQTGYASDLKDAYEKADRLNPAPQPAAPPPPAPAPQPRPALSVTGAPSSGSNPGNRQPSTTRREALARAMQASGLA